ncbi:RCC1 domain-containing protein [Edaphovirga cremea]|uniref:RCC1 domain-containing protein n=1 Tax=Edaphovirga cremea TaxID=2267246 RepID=UPI00398931AC
MNNKKVSHNETSKILIMGARSVNNPAYNYSVNRLVALNPHTLQPLMAVWKYDNESMATEADSFRDLHPSQPLTVSAAGYDTVTLNTSNIVGNAMALAIRMIDGRVIVCGDISSGGAQPADIDNYDFTELASAGHAFAAQRSNGSIFAWGDTMDGGKLPSSIASRQDIIDIAGAGASFALLASAPPYIQCWGNNNLGAIDVPNNISSMPTLRTLVTANNAFAVLNDAGQMFAWGEGQYGGLIPDAISDLSDVVSITAATEAFAALRANGQVVAWGNSVNGGALPESIAALDDIKQICGTYRAFCALRENGQVVAWGSESRGGTIPAEIASLTTIVDIQANNSAFAALCADGSVVAWGNPDYATQVPEGLTDVVALTGNCYCFAALKKEGSVTAWGNTAYGGDTASVAALLTDVRAIYSSQSVFIALKEDDTLVVWGDPASGGSMAMLPEEVQGNVSYYLYPSYLELQGC